MASEIPPEKIALSRLDYDPEDLFGIGDTFTLKELKQRRADLLSAYHPDVNNRFGSELSSYMNARAAEINNEFDELSPRAIKSVRTEKPQSRRRTKPEGLGAVAGTPVDDFVTKERKGAKVRRK